MRGERGVPQQALKTGILPVVLREWVHVCVCDLKPLLLLEVFLPLITVKNSHDGFLKVAAPHIYPIK